MTAGEIIRARHAGRSGSDRDRLVTQHLSRAAWRVQSRSPAPVDRWDLPGKSHLLLAETGWQKIANAALDWIERMDHD